MSLWFTPIDSFYIRIGHGIYPSEGTIPHLKFLCKVQPIQSSSKFFFFLFIHIRIDLDPPITTITLLFKIDPIFSDKFAKYGQLRIFFQHVHLQENDSTVSPFRDVFLKLFFPDSPTRVDSKQVISRAIKI